MIPELPPDKWAMVKSIAGEAMDLAPGERAGYLDSSCDPELRPHVEALLGAHDKADRSEFLGSLFSGNPPADLGLTPGSDGAGAMVGKRVGRYRIKRVIGEGGMGTVYEAVQEQPRRIVALKLMRAGLSSRSAQRRFEYESQVLGRLRHPGIAQIFEAGTHEGEAGTLPFFAMEFIPGAAPITAFARERRLPMRERLRLFLEVCDAVQHGHQRGIVHRDLKPSNILVDSSGNPKIIDFGIARATHGDPTVATLQTGVGQLIGTPQYMSPEQCVGDPNDLDIRSDVYSLGVVLYQLLLERPPYHLGQAPLLEAVRIVREATPTRPSSIDAALRGDVETILLKALEKDRSRRYQSAADFARDIELFLNGKPITARPPTVAYQLKLFARRHKALIAAATVGALATLAGLAGTGIGLYQATQALNRAKAAELQARQEALKARRVADFLRETLGAAVPGAVLPGDANQHDLDYAPWEHRGRLILGSDRNLPTTSVHQLLETAADRLERAFRDDPQTRAELRLQIGWILAQLGRVNEGLALLRPALGEIRRLHGADHDLTIQAMLDISNFEGITGDMERAAAMTEDALSLCTGRYGPHSPLTLQISRRFAHSLLYSSRGPAAAVRHQQRVVDDLSLSLGADNPATLVEMTMLAETMSQSGDAAGAEATARRAWEGLKKNPGPSARATADAGITLARILGRSGRDTRLAAQLCGSAVEYYTWRIGPDNPTTNELRKVHVQMLMALGDFTRAQAVAREVLDSHTRSLGPDALETLKSASRLARVLIAANTRLEEAESLARKAAEQTPPITSPLEDYAVFHAATLQAARRARGQARDAERELSGLIAAKTASTTAPLPWVMAYLLTERAEALIDLGRPEEARALLDEALIQGDSLADRSHHLRVGVLRALIRLTETTSPAEAERFRTMLPTP